MEQRLSLITLGVADVGRAQAFYESLGWQLDGGVDDESDHVAFFQTSGIIFALWDRGKLEKDSAVEDSGGWGGVTLAHNVGSPAEVDAVLDEAQQAGATIGRPGTPTFWGGYSGIFIDPDGHPWEIAHNPGWTVHEDGRTTLK
jgi:catechol 2,3-dioxygenase-like lactoylglutathione lyase family enzyme